MVRRPVAMLALGIALLVGAGLRCWRLDAPPLWLDESVTSLVAAGRGPDAFSIGRVQRLAAVVDQFNPIVTATPRDVFTTFRDPRVQDLHPPTFHLLANLALRSGLRSASPLVPRVRMLAVILGTFAIAAMYVAARRSFDAATALTAAALVAVSPYAVMLSREARNYSLAMLMVTLSLGATLAVARRIAEHRPALGWWAAWAALSAAGFYAHYFALFAWLAQGAALALVARRSRSIGAPIALGIAALTALVAAVPLAPLFMAHAASPEQRWLRFEVYGSSPFDMPYRIASAWQTMLLGKAWSMGEPTYQISRALSLLLFLGIAAAVVIALSRTDPHTPEDQSPRLLAVIVGLTVLECTAAAVVLGRDFISQVRYHVVYYPPLAMTVAWAIARRPWPAALAALLVAGVVNSALVDLDIESWKPTDLPAVMAHLGVARRPALIVVGIGSFNEIVAHAGFQYAFAQRSGADDRSVAFVRRTDAYASLDPHANPSTFWSGVSQLRPVTLPAALLVHSDGMLPDEYRPTVTIHSESGGSVVCTGITLHDPTNATDNSLIRPVYRRYDCSPVAAGAR